MRPVVAAARGSRQPQSADRLRHSCDARRMPRRRPAALLVLALSAVPAAGVGWSCGVTDSGQATCFASSCQQLVGAIATGIAHITLTADLTPGTDATFAACAAAYPIRVARPLTLQGACGAARCALHGGATVARTGSSSCLRGCVQCAGGGQSIFAVKAGGSLALDSVQLSGACNPAGNGGAISLAGGHDDATVPAGRRALHNLRHAPPPPPPPSFAPADVARLTAINCRFSNNAAMGGGGSGNGLWNGHGGAVAMLNVQTAALFSDCQFEANYAWGSESASSYAGNWGDGGAVYIGGGRATFALCSFAGCEAERSGGAVAAVDGAVVDFSSCIFDACAAADDYFDGGGAVFVAGAATAASFELCRFQNCAVRQYPDPRRQSLTCGGGAASVVTGASASFSYSVFSGNTAPRGGAVCVHDATAAFNSPVLAAGNTAGRAWFGTPGAAVECVMCGARAVPTADCVLLRDAAAVARERGGSPVCRPLPDSPAAAALREWWLAQAAIDNAASVPAAPVTEHRGFFGSW